jgi:hypothetical protein
MARLLYFPAVPVARHFRRKLDWVLTVAARWVDYRRVLPDPGCCEERYRLSVRLSQNDRLTRNVEVNS